MSEETESKPRKRDAPLLLFVTFALLALITPALTYYLNGMGRAYGQHAQLAGGVMVGVMLGYPFLMLLMFSRRFGSRVLHLVLFVAVAIIGAIIGPSMTPSESTHWRETRAEEHLRAWRDWLLANNARDLTDEEAMRAHSERLPGMISMLVEEASENAVVLRYSLNDWYDFKVDVACESDGRITSFEVTALPQDGQRDTMARYALLRDGVIRYAVDGSAPVESSAVLPDSL